MNKNLLFSVFILSFIFFSGCSLRRPSSGDTQDVSSSDQFFNSRQAGDSGQIQDTATPSLSADYEVQLLQSLESLPDLTDDSSQIDSTLQ